MRSFTPALLITLTLSAGVSWAFVLDEDGNGHPLYWPEMPVHYQLVRSNVPGGAAGEEAVHRAFDSWTAASSNVEYDFAGYVDQGVQANDGRNLVYWIYENWPHDATLAALTYRYYDTSDGHILDADIVFNGEGYAWSVGGDGYDIQNSATHEVGHFSGLGHSQDPDSTMYGKTVAGETQKQTLSGDDVAGLDALYGGAYPVVSSQTSQLSSSSGGVNAAGGADGAGGAGGGGGGCSLGRSPQTPDLRDLLAPVLLLALLALHRWRARRSRE